MPTTDEIRRELDATEFSAGMIHGVDCSCSQCRIARYCRLLCDEVDASSMSTNTTNTYAAARRAREEAP